ncbi:MAG: hypothetical protein AAGF11_42460 [Myxococcota bacterium]
MLEPEPEPEPEPLPVELEPPVVPEVEPELEPTPDIVLVDSRLDVLEEPDSVVVVAVVSSAGPLLLDDVGPEEEVVFAGDIVVPELEPTLSIGGGGEVESSGMQLLPRGRARTQALAVRRRDIRMR